MKQNTQGAKAPTLLQRLQESPISRFLLILMASIIMAANIKSFVNAGGLFPGGFNGLTLLIQRSAAQFAHIDLPFTPINLLLNAIPAAISFKLIGKWFTAYSCLMIALTSIFTDLLPAMTLTNDVLLVCIFGGMIQGLAISLCLMGRATSGGTDFIAAAISERMGVDAWNYIFGGNCLMLVVAGLLFGWDKALYSIVFQFASTQVVHRLDARFKRTTLFIITNKAQEIYAGIMGTTHHGATLFHGASLYTGAERDMIYSVIDSNQVKTVTKVVREIDPQAFVNVLKTNQVSGNYYRRPND